MATTDSTSAGQPLRQLRWPALPAVDLLAECRWLVNLDARNANPARKPRQIKDNACHGLDLQNETITDKELQGLSKQSSPYRQPLRHPKPPAPSPGSPAQRAAKSILKLKEGLLRLDGSKWTADCQGDSTIDAYHFHQQQPVSRSNTCSTPKPSDSGSSLGTSRVRSPSPDRAKTPQRSPSRKKKKRPSTREERQLAEKQARLAVWLKANPDASPAHEIQDSRGGDGLPADGYMYSVEVKSRIKSAMQCRGPLEAGVRLWDDPVRSLLAAEMSSESVFGGAVPTRALAYQPPRVVSLSCPPDDEPPQQNSPPKKLQTTIQEESLFNEIPSPTDNERDNQAEVDSLTTSATKFEMSDLAQSVFGTAHRQVADGAVADALATLEAGIRQSLSISQAHLDAVSGSHGVGFNYSVLAHDSATKLQLYYRARHRQRLNRLVFLQRQWRWWHTRKRALSSVHFAHKQALVIQRRYRPWHTHITQVRSAVRIQRCFHVFASQKFLVRFRQVCRLLLARQARRRQVKTRMQMVGKIVLLWRKRRRWISLVQGLWRRRCARAQLATLLAHVSAVEIERRAREDEFVARKLAPIILSFRNFLTNTKLGRTLVCWQAEKPWLRFRRLRHDSRQWDELPLSEKIDAVAGVLTGRIIRGLQLRALCQMLVGKDKPLPAIPKVLKVSTDALGFLVAPSTINPPKLVESIGCYGCCPWWAGFREKVKRTRAKLSRRGVTLWWTVVTYPKEFCVARVWPVRGHRHIRARQQLENDFARVLAAFLRVWFRRMDSKSNTPPYVCEWCSESFSISRYYFAHGKCAAARARAEAEWTALSSDVKFARSIKWRLAWQYHGNPVRPEIHDFELDAASVRRLRRTHSRRKALMLLVATLEACTAGESPNAVIPLDLVGFVLQYIDENNASHLLMQTAEHQLVQWSTLVGSMEVESSRLTPEGVGNESRWIRKDELRSRLIVGGRWRSVLTRLRRNLGWRSTKYRPGPALHAGNAVALKLKVPRVAGQIATKWKELQLRVRRVVQRRHNGPQAPMSLPSAAGTRVLPVAT